VRKVIISVVGLVAAVSAFVPAVASANDGAPHGPSKSILAVYGDSPYGKSNLDPALADTAQFGATDKFVDSINVDPQVGLVLNVGDIHSGKEFCTRQYDQAIFDKWKRFADPVVYTPGDNEWSDCHKAAEGGNVFLDPPTNSLPVDYANGDPVANLDLVRKIFFPRPGVTLGTNKKVVLSQKYVYDRRHPTDAKYVENVMWVQSGALFVTINLPGGSNNDTDTWYDSTGTLPNTAAQTQERVERTGADLRWLDAAFAVAKFAHVKGVVIGAQADMWDPEKGVAHEAGYEPFVSSVASHTLDFGKPVLMFNGDSHVYRSENPLDPAAPCTWELASACTSVAFMHPGYNVPNFHRVVVHGSSAPMEWLKLTVDPSVNVPASDTAFGPFSWQRKTQALP
jgi:hypothetical protein